MRDEFNRIIPEDAVERYRSRKMVTALGGIVVLNPWQYSRAKVETHPSQEHLWDVEDVAQYRKSKET